jgi:hypothetical protein
MVENKLMEANKQHLVVFLGRGDEVMVELFLPKQKWARVLQGEKLHVVGSGYHYEGEFFRDDWYFNSNKKMETYTLLTQTIW